MGQRSRKRGQRTHRAGTPRARASVREPAAGAVREPAAGAAAPSAEDRISRSEERNAAVRAALSPLAPGERPWSIRIAVVIALLVGVGDLVDVVVGGRFGFGSNHAGAGGVVLFSLLMLICAGGMWYLRYWAVLGFQMILGIVILLFSLLFIRASNVLGFVVAGVVVGGGGWLFYKLVRVLSRIQMPRYPGR